MSKSFYEHGGFPGWSPGMAIGAGGARAALGPQRQQERLQEDLLFPCGMSFPGSSRGWLLSEAAWPCCLGWCLSPGLPPHAPHLPTPCLAGTNGPGPRMQVLDAPCRLQACPDHPPPLYLALNWDGALLRLSAG